MTVLLAVIVVVFGGILDGEAASRQRSFGSLRGRKSSSRLPKSPTYTATPEAPPPPPAVRLEHFAGKWVDVSQPGAAIHVHVVDGRTLHFLDETGVAWNVRLGVQYVSHTVGMLTDSNGKKVQRDLAVMTVNDRTKSLEIREEISVSGRAVVSETRLRLRSDGKRLEVSRDGDAVGVFRRVGPAENRVAPGGRPETIAYTHFLHEYMQSVTAKAQELRRICRLPTLPDHVHPPDDTNWI